MTISELFPVPVDGSPQENSGSAALRRLRMETGLPGFDVERLPPLEHLLLIGALSLLLWTALIGAVAAIL